MVGCGDDDGSMDAGRDAGVDAPAADAPATDAPGTDAPMGEDAPATADAGTDAGPIEPVDPFDGIGEVELVAVRFEGTDFRFLEGPHWRPDGTLVFSDLSFGAADRATIYALTPPSELAIVRRPSGGANGNATAPDGALVSCLQADRRVVRGEGDTTTVFERYMGMRLNAPNDLVYRSDGTWYFTDPGYGAEGSEELPYRGLFRVTPEGELSVAYENGRDGRRPNGVELSPDESTLYLANTAAGDVVQFAVQPDGSLEGPTDFTLEAPGADGMAVDATGNVYVTTSEGVRVFHPDGTAWGTIAIPRQPANCAFGDPDRRTLYVTARQGLYRVRLPVAGR